MLTSEVAVLRSRHGISVKCSRHRDTGPTDPSLPNTTFKNYFGSNFNDKHKIIEMGLVKIRHPCVSRV